MAKTDVDIDYGWKKVLKNQFEAPYFSELKAFLVNEKKKHIVYLKYWGD